MKNFIFLFVIIIFISSCCREGKTFRIKNKDKLRFNENDTFIYKSNYNNFDTLFIDEIKEGKNDQYIHEGLCAGKTFYQEKIFYYYQSYPVAFKEEERPFLLITNNSEVITFSTYFPKNEFESKKYLNYIGKYYIGDSIYSDVEYFLVVDKINNELLFKYYYNKEYGFLSYEFQDGEKFGLYKYIPFE